MRVWEWKGKQFFNRTDTHSFEAFLFRSINDWFHCFAFNKWLIVISFTDCSLHKQTNKQTNNSLCSNCDAWSPVISNQPHQRTLCEVWKWLFLYDRRVPEHWPTLVSLKSSHLHSTALTAVHTSWSYWNWCSKNKNYTNNLWATDHMINRISVHVHLWSIKCYFYRLLMCWIVAFQQVKYRW